MERPFLNPVSPSGSYRPSRERAAMESSRRAHEERRPGFSKRREVAQVFRLPATLTGHLETKSN